MHTEFPTFRGRHPWPFIHRSALLAALAVAAIGCNDSAAVERPVPDQADGSAAERPAGERGSDSGATGDLAALVNGEAVPLSEFQMQAFAAQTYYVDQGLDPNSEEGQEQLRSLRREVLRDLIHQRLIEQYAAREGITVTDADVEAGLEEDIVHLGGEDQFDAYLAQARTTREDVAEMKRTSILGAAVIQRVVGDVPDTAPHVHARHILCDDESTCRRARDRIVAGDDFAAVAREISRDETTAERGGDLDWLARGLLFSALFEDAVFALQPGDLSDVVATDFGYHVIEVLARDDARALSEEQRFALREKQFLDWIADQRQSATITIFIDDLQGAGS